MLNRCKYTLNELLTAGAPKAGAGLRRGEVIETQRRHLGDAELMFTTLQPILGSIPACPS